MKKILLIASAALLLAGCMPQKTLYSWGKYEERSYSYVKTNTDEDLEKLLKEYQYIISHQKGGRKTVPPGIYADYGYLLVRQGKVAEGIAMMKMEIALYPESAGFVEGIIKRLEQ
ncbi:MAG: DUF4810 domain-containing protein [Prevotellaceae bacterium]|jgi:hypothetical protein|nr:DUF4810 domain-containing protein [Prevotellaceae bacterium]